MKYKFENGSFLKVIRSKDTKRSRRVDGQMNYNELCNSMDLSQEDMKNLIKIILLLEYLGIHIEKSKIIGTKQICYFSVPEFSTIKSSSEDYGDGTYTSEGLMKLAENQLSDIYMAIIFKDTDENDPFDKEFINEVKEKFSDYFGFYGKIRTGQVWNEELGKKAVEDAVKTDYVQVK